MIIIPNSVDIVDSTDDSLIIVKGESIHIFNSSAKLLYSIICEKPSIKTLIEKIKKAYSVEWQSSSEEILADIIETLIQLESLSLLSFQEQ